MPDQSTNRPVIFLAFANDRVDDAAYLRNLPKELGGIRDALRQAVKADLCEVVERANVTVDQILDVFQDSYYKDRIAVFHYGGHANGYQLLLETAEGQHASAHSEGLVSFLAKQQGLKLIFLNGCSSQQQALDLVESGISAVIGTSQSINDDVATSLAVRFYSSLGNGANLGRAWNEAIDQVKIQKGTANMRDLFFDGMDDELSLDTSGDNQNATTASVPTLDRFPWEIYIRDGAELVKNWNLPESVDNPLFGLPEPLEQNLPEKPYRFLERYTRDHCDIFFGRSYYIRDLYLSAIDKSTAPIILFYGQSGVGKSSMLDAGVFPRLEQFCQVVYVRRDERQGLLGTLQNALGLSQEQASKMQTKNPELVKTSEQIAQLELLLNTSPEIVKPQLKQAIEELKSIHQAEKKKDQVNGLGEESERSLLDVWLTTEKTGAKPLVILLDQVEEAFTRPNDDLPNELEEFMEEVKQLFQYPSNRPQGKLILSYRKEYHPEINEACKNFALPREEIFLKALARQDIVEVITGLTRTNKLQKRYRLTVEDELPVIIADDLLEDKESPIAPVLQILLTKMWNLTEGEELRYFSVDKYQALRKQGILMDDFFEEQMEHLHRLFPEYVESGLALDVLKCHTTKMGTANAKSVDELRERYIDRQHIVDKLLESFKTLYLLASAGSKRTGLAHDTLAPLVLSEFRKSDKPGQRASIILENKVIAFEQNPEAVIDIDDLKLVEEGAAGMRLWTAQEEELVKRSQENRKRVLAFKRRVRRLGIVAVILILGASVFAFYQSQVAKEKRKEAEVEKNNALIAEKDAKEQRDLAKKEKEEADIARDKAKEETLKADIARDKAKEEEAKALIAKKQADIERDKAIKAKAEEEKQKLLAKKKEEEARKQKEIADMARDKAEKEEKRASFQKQLATAQQIAVKSQLITEDKEGKALVALESYEELMKLKKQANSLDEEFVLPPEAFQAMEAALSEYIDDQVVKGDAWAFGQQGKRLAIIDNGRLLIGSLTSDGKATPSFTTTAGNSITLQEPDARNYSIYQFKEGGLAYGTSSGNVYIKQFGNPEKLYNQHGQNIVAIEYLNSNDKKWLSSVSNKELVTWDLDGNEEIGRIPLNTIFNDMLWDADNRLLLAGRDGMVKAFTIEDLKNAAATGAQITKHHIALRCMAFEPTKKWLVLGATDGELLILDLNHGNTQHMFSKIHQGEVTAAAFSADGKRFATASYDGTVMVWQVNIAKSAKSLSQQMPAIIKNKQKVFSLSFTADSKYVLFSDRDGLHARIAEENLLYEQLKKVTKGKKLSDEKRALYIGE